MEFINRCKQFLAVESTLSQGSSEIVQLAKKWCHEIGLETDEQSFAYSGRKSQNILAFPSHQAPPNFFLFLQSHLGTKPPGSHAHWTRTGGNPFDPSLYQGSLYGLGVGQAKLDFLCKLEALKRINLEKLKKPIALIGTSGPSESVNGALTLLKKGYRAEYVLCGEVTNLSVVTRGLGVLNAELVIPFSEEEKRLRSEHNLSETASSQSKMFFTNAKNPNPLRQMLDFFQDLPSNACLLDVYGGDRYGTLPKEVFVEVDFFSSINESVILKIYNIFKKINLIEKKFKLIGDSRFNPPYSQLQLCRIMVTEEDVRILGRVSFTPKVNEAHYLEWISDLKDICKSFESDFKIMNRIPPFEIDEEDDFILKSLEIIQKNSPKSSSKTQSFENVSKAGLFARAGIKPICFGAGELLEENQNHEKGILTKDLLTSVDFYQKIIEKTCL